MRFRKTLIWTLLNKECKNHPDFTGKTKEESAFDLFEALFPGVSAFGLSGTGELRDECVKPLLAKLFPELVGVPPDVVTPDETVGVSMFLRCEGYQWQEKAWRVKLARRLSKM